MNDPVPPPINTKQESLTASPSSDSNPRSSNPRSPIHLNTPTQDTNDATRSTRSRHIAVYSSPTLSPVLKFVSLTPTPRSASHHKPKGHYDTHSMNAIDLSATIEQIYEEEQKQHKLRKSTSIRHLKRTMSRDTLVNTARSLSSATSKAMIKIKNMNPDEMHKDSADVKQSKANLASFSAMNKVLAASKKLHNMQNARIHCMKEFSSTIHSAIDLGRNRGITNNYFGQYLKMMASTTHSVQQIYSEYNDNFKKHLIDPFEEFLCDADIQQCVNNKYQYNKIRNNFNYNSNSKKRLDLQEIESSFICATNQLIKKRQESLMHELEHFEQCLCEYARKKSDYIQSKRSILGYDEMKQNKSKMRHQIQNEMVNVNKSEEWNGCFDDNDDKLFSIIFFHRNKFPPSTKFLMECVAPLCSKYMNIKFIIVHYTCSELLEKYNINVFPTCLVFDGRLVCNKYAPIVGNSSTTRQELQYICKQLDKEVDNDS